MKSFPDYVTDERIIECVCHKRTAEATKRHDAHHNHAICSDYTVSSHFSSVYELTPPRRKWIQLGNGGRYKILPGGERQLISTADRTYRSCLWTIKRDIKNGSDAPYLTRLRNFIKGVKDRITNDDYKINTPLTIPVFKKKSKSKDGPDEYRPICLFSDLYDAVIIILANRYLSLLFDQFFYENSLAFRPKRMFQGRMTTTFHHEAIGLVTSYLTHFKTQDIYVAECDMQKFYDTVDHKVVSNEYSTLLKQIQSAYPDVSFDEITRIFNSYLQCYTFTDNVWRKNKDCEYWKKYGIDVGKGVFGWVKDYQKLADDPHVEMRRVGVPQGGALSGLIANIVINRVDQEMLPELHSNEDLYIRYCDDMLLLSTNRKRCEHLFQIYSEGIKSVKLVPHPPETVVFGTAKYWETKTKPVYKWVDDNRTEGSRWIGFVGYEIRRNGDVRIRKASLKKEKRKQHNVINRIFELTYKKHRVSDESLENSYRGTLMSMAVGRASLWNYKTLKNEYCWVNGFKMLNGNQTVRTQIRDLDRCRNHLIHRANKRLERLTSKVSGKIPKEGRNIGNKKAVADKDPVIRYYGKPFSYYCHYEKQIND